MPEATRPREAEQFRPRAPLWDESSSPAQAGASRLVSVQRSFGLTV